MMRFIFLLHVILLGAIGSAQAQCKLTVLGSDYIVCYDQAESLELFAEAYCKPPLYNDFENNSLSQGWSSGQEVIFDPTCPPITFPASGSICWLGLGGADSRYVQTPTTDLTQAPSACYLEWDMTFANQVNPTFCDGPDLPGEGVYLQARSAQSNEYIDIKYYPANPNFSGSFYNWNHYLYFIPPKLISSETQFRWYQAANSGAHFDHWGIDNVEINCDGLQTSYIWNTGDTTPHIQPNPKKSQYYAVTVSNGFHTSSDSIYIVVVPSISGMLGPDTMIKFYDKLEFSLPYTVGTFHWSNGSTSSSASFDFDYMRNDSLIWVQYTHPQGCESRDSVYVKLDYSLGLVESREKKEIHLQPNPANDQVRVSWANHKIGKVKVFGIMGELVHEEFCNNANQIDLHIAHLKPGTYIITLEDETEVVQEILLKE